MKEVITTALLVCAIALGVYGAMSSPKPETPVERLSEPAVLKRDNGPQHAPRGPSDLRTEYDEIELTTPPEEWLKFSPMRVKMRSMWLDCGIIVARTTAPLIDFDGLESAANDLVRKAGQFAEMWEAVRDHNRSMAGYAKEGDWFNARYESQRLWMACTDCHVENWSPFTRGFEPESLQAWYEQGHATENAPYANIRLTAPRGFIQEMIFMMRNLNWAIGDIGEHHEEGVMESSKVIHGFAVEQIHFWRNIERYADNIREAASKIEITGIRENYYKVIGNCTGCHAKYVHDGRLPLNPLPFPADDE